MEYFETISYVSGAFWHCSKGRDESFELIDLSSKTNGIIPIKNPDADLSEFFDLFDQENEIARYMNENHSEIRNMLDGKHEKYNLCGISILSNGLIRFHFTNGVYFTGDNVPLNMKKCPCFMVLFDDPTRKRFVIESEKKDFFSDSPIIVEIRAYQFDSEYRTIKTGHLDGKPVVFVTERN